MADDGGLAGAVWSEQPEDLAGLGPKGDIVHRKMSGKAFYDVSNLENHKRPQEPQPLSTLPSAKPTCGCDTLKHRI